MKAGALLASAGFFDPASMGFGIRGTARAQERVVGRLDALREYKRVEVDVAACTVHLSVQMLNDEHAGVDFAVTLC
jgi:hypothetical protein